MLAALLRLPLPDGRGGSRSALLATARAPGTLQRREPVNVLPPRLSTPASPACTPFPPRSSALQSPPACLWRPSLSRPAPLGAPLGSHPAGPGFSGHASPCAFRTSAPGPTFQTQRFKEKQTPCTQLTRRGENISFSKPPAHRTPLVPSGDHRCSATVEICLPEAGTGEYFWPN